jgi:hypothetical protein
MQTRLRAPWYTAKDSLPYSYLLLENKISLILNHDRLSKKTTKAVAAARLANYTPIGQRESLKAPTVLQGGDGVGAATQSSLQCHNLRLP